MRSVIPRWRVAGQHALTLAQHAYVLEAGRVALSGSGAELLANEGVRKAYLGL